MLHLTSIHHLAVETEWPYRAEKAPTNQALEWFSEAPPDSCREHDHSFGWARTVVNLKLISISLESTFNSSSKLNKQRRLRNWLVVWTPLKHISQLGWLFPIYGKIKVMFQTTNRKIKKHLKRGCQQHPPDSPSQGRVAALRYHCTDSRKRLRCTEQGLHSI